MLRLQVTLDRTEAEKLAKWAKAELRDPRDQIRYIVRNALEERESTQQPQRQRGQGERHGQHS